jgi:amino acid adenylation domain-containing protein
MDNGIARRLIEHAQNGILIHISNGALRVSDPEGRLTGPERQELKNNKELILKLFAAWGVKSNSNIGPLSYQQRRLWLIDKIEPGSAQYNMPWALHFNGKLDANALRRALSAILDRHQVLRTVYKADERGEGIQVIREAVELPLPTVDLSHLAGGEQAREVSRLTETEASLPFDLTSDLMLRASLLRLSAESWVLLVTMHHIATDGWSEGVLTSELGSLYAAFVQGRENPLPPLPIQYMDYAHWQQEWLQDKALKKQLEYWVRELRNLPTVHNLPLDRIRPSIPSYRGGVVHWRLSADIRQGLNSLAQSRGATLFMVLYAAFAALLSRYSGETDIVIGSPIANREQAELAPLVGFFVNTLVLRSDLSGDPGFIDLLAQSKERLLAAYKHQQILFEKLVDELKPERSLGHNPLFQVMLVLHNNEQVGMNLPGLTLHSAESVRVVSKFDLTLNVTEDLNKDDLRLDWEYAEDLFEASTIERMAGHFEVLLKGVIKEPDIQISKLPLLTAAEKNRLLVEWNNTQVEYPQDKTIHQLFEEQVEQRPGAIALVYEDQQLSYEELNRQANRLAHYLIKQGVRPDALVGICLERSPEMVISILGILKAGGCYLPLDPAYPEQRICYILENSAVERVLTHSGLQPVLGILGGRGICLDRLDLRDQLSVNPGIRLEPQHAAYAIYTSGSTGQPKGVVNHHGGLMNRLEWMQRKLQMSPADKVLQKTPFTFDVSVWEFLWPLREGAQLVLARPEGHKDPEYLSEVIQKCGISILHFVPSMLEAFLSARVLPSMNSLKLVVCSGEELPRELVRKFKAWSGSIGLYNLYGPTEASIDVSCFICEGLPEQRIPIGRPIDNTQLFILDSQLTPVPVGVPGELYIGGVGLARGYLNRPDLTAERFVHCPFGGRGERLYRTGDLARYLPDGNIEFLGRMDHQVKIRGFRIELGEIEHALLSQPEIKEAVVVARARGEGDKYLVAYLVPQALSGQLDHEVLRQALRTKLPEYMVPSYFVELDVLPLSSNGKVDRKALPEVDVSEQQGVYIAPRTRTERMLCEIWREVLGVERVGALDNFFRLGGHSLSATRLVARINEAFEVALPLKMLFKVQTLEGLAREIAQLDKDLSRPVLVRVSRDDALLPSYAQQRLWLLDGIDGGSAHYNMPSALRLSGLLDVEALNRTFSSIVERHESLRTCFAAGEDGQPVQVIRKAEPFVIPVSDLSALTEAERQSRIVQLTREEASKEFDLSADLMMRGRLLKLGEAEHILLVTLHHIASDGWSMSILIDEFSALYGAYSEGRENPLAPLAIQYADYAHWQREWLRGEVLEEQLEYWVDRLAGLPVVHSLPLDHPRPAVQTFAGRSHWSRLGQEVTQSLRELCQGQGATLFMGLHAAFAVLLSRYSNETDIVVGSPIANREQAEVANLIGFFVNNLVLRSDLSGSPGFNEVLSQSKQTLLDAYARQQVPFEQIVERLQPQRSLSHSPLFQVMLVLQNNEAGVLELPGLTASPMGQGGTIAKFDLTLNVMEDHSRGGLNLEWEYAKGLFEASTIERMAGHFELLLKQLISNPQCDVHALDMLSEAERRQFREWNSTSRLFPEKCIHELFEEEVERNPEAAAVVYEDQRLSYGELNARANRLAHYLRAQGVGPDTLVGVCLERSVGLVVSILGILKAGGAYVPLDPEYPAARLEYMLEDAGLSTVLTSTQLRPRLTQTAARAVSVDEIQPALAACPGVNPQVPDLTPAHLAYVIYTSGSSGNAKGVMIEHKSLVNLVHSDRSTFDLGTQSRVLHPLSLGFDAGSGYLWNTLCCGGCLYLVVPDDQLFVKAASLAASHVVMPAALLGAQCRADLSRLQALICGGEAPPAGLVREIAAQTRFFNVYGPTETTVTATCVRLTGEGPVHIGGPIDNVQLYVVNGAGRLLPVGVPGELYIGGPGVARGYLNRPDLTREKFIPNPFYDKDGTDCCERLYRTGDLVRWSPDGNLEFLGRIDHQVKIRGFRIELGEIENALLLRPEVKEAVVVVHARDGGDRYLVAHVVPQALSNLEGRVRLDHEVLQQALRAELPVYMVPSYFVEHDALPLTPNGKVDRKALPAPDTDPSKSRYIAPRTEKERELARIFSRLLGISEDSIGIDDNFFELGGDSLMVVRLASKCKQSGMDLSVKQIYMHPTIAELAQLENDGSGELENQKPISGEIPLLNAQEWFLKQNFANANRWNVIVNFDVHRSLNAEVLRESVRRVMILHDSLRARFNSKEGKWTTQILEFDGDVPFSCLDLSDQSFPEGKDAHFMRLLDAWEDSLSFTEGPLIRVSYVCYGENPVGRLSFVVHHLAVDAYSIKIVIEDLFEFYRQLSSSSEVISPPKTASVRKIAEWSRCSEEVEVIGSDLKKWFAALPWDRIPRIPRDLGDGNTPNNWGSSRSLNRSLGKAGTRALQELAKQTAMTFEDFLLLALVNSITSWTRYDYMQVTVIDAGRDLLSRVAGFDVSRSVGWISMARLLFLRRITGSADERIQAMKEQLANIPYKGLLIGDYDPFANDPERRLISDEIKFNFGGIVESGADNIGGMGNFLTYRYDLWSQIPNEESDRAVLLQCQCNIFQGELIVRWDYSINLHLPSTIERLASQFIRELEVLLPADIPA